MLARTILMGLLCREDEKMILGYDISFSIQHVPALSFGAIN